MLRRLVVLTLCFGLVGCGQDAPMTEPCAAPGEYTETARVDVAGGVSVLASDGALVAIASLEGVRVFEGAALAPAGSVDGSFVDVTFEAGLLIAHDGADAQVYELSTGGLVRRGVVDVSGEARIAVRDGHLVAVRHAEGARIATFEVTSLAELTDPRRLGEATISSQGPVDIALGSATAFSLGVDAAINAFDMSEPANPVAVGMVAVSGTSTGSQLALVGDVLLVGTPTGVLSFDVADPSAPTALESVPGGELVTATEGRLATVVGEQLIVYRLDSTGAAEETLRHAVPATTALAWHGESLLRGDTAGFSRLELCTE